MKKQAILIRMEEEIYLIINSFLNYGLDSINPLGCDLAFKSHSGRTSRVKEDFFYLCLDQKNSNILESDSRKEREEKRTRNIIRIGIN